MGQSKSALLLSDPAISVPDNDYLEADTGDTIIILYSILYFAPYHSTGKQIFLTLSSIQSSSSSFWVTWPCQTSAVWPRAVSCCTSTAAIRCSTPSWVCSLTGPGWVTPRSDTCRAAACSSRGSTCLGPATVELSHWPALAGQPQEQKERKWPWKTSHTLNHFDLVWEKKWSYDVSGVKKETMKGCY